MGAEPLDPFRSVRSRLFRHGLALTTKRLDPVSDSSNILPMVTLAEIETLAFSLPESDRAKLAAGLLDSLPGVLDDDDDGLAEALRRSEEMDRDPSACVNHEEFLKALGRSA
jgi:Putative addiction module component